LVFVTVGNAKQSFHRLLDAVNELATIGFFGSEQVVAQNGHSIFTNSHLTCKPFLSEMEFKNHIEEATLVISHGGGTPLHVVLLGRVPVVMPRLKKYKEHVNNHQLEFVRVLVREGWAIPAWEPADLGEAIRKAKAMGGTAIPPKAPMIDMVQKAIRDFAGK
jgi:UDP-N-acetylglucosamine transferase subunit ALG13